MTSETEKNYKIGEKFWDSSSR